MTRVFVKPTPFDVLCGRGKACFDHLGNQRFRQIIEQTLPKYSKAKTKGEKTFFVRLVVNHIAVQGGRFLKLDRDSNQWYEGDVICAKSKVGHAFRDAKETRSHLPEGVESLLLLQRAVESKKEREAAQRQEEKEENEDPSNKDEDDSHRERLKNLKVLKDSMDGKTFAMPLEDLPDVTDLASIKQAMMRTLIKRQYPAKGPISPETPGAATLAPKSPATITPGSLGSPGISLPSASPVFGQLKQAMMRTLVLRQQALNERPSKTEILRRAIQAQQNAQTLQKSPIQILSEAIKVQQNANRKRNLTPDALRHIQSQMVVQVGPPPTKKQRTENAAEQW
eukprot:CAMPEP_0202446306 /NCGR_PEP_ID=MMETSP1360-20130828/4840_1 /ASSEMBLY_ACC=CAM_ASM_000848 /TAXON_ID=515479 /ORGANISM="Licmophora paradoxa, Strain CCMP2313" /LENGTH=337 /DNA_ID=CAMNT_0049062751 /DNA_START=28 /DNA_END=1038 /DNA_ORIENTATION=-